MVPEPGNVALVGLLALRRRPKAAAMPGMLDQTSSLHLYRGRSTSAQESWRRRFLP